MPIRHAMLINVIKGGHAITDLITVDVFHDAPKGQYSIHKCHKAFVLGMILGFFLFFF